MCLVDSASTNKAQQSMVSFKSEIKAAESFKLSVENLKNNLQKSDNQGEKRLQSMPEENMTRIKSFVTEHGGNCPIQRVLLANNGIAAVKEMRSVRKWAYETFGNERIIEFVAMATPDDFKANAEYIKMADRVVEVPGGTNNNNFANVDLIVRLAQENQVQVTQVFYQFVCCNHFNIGCLGWMGTRFRKSQVTRKIIAMYPSDCICRSKSCVYESFGGQNIIHNCCTISQYSCYSLEWFRSHHESG